MAQKATTAVLLASDMVLLLGTSCWDWREDVRVAPDLQFCRASQGLELKTLSIVQVGALYSPTSSRALV
jgi:hypothetical protein